MTFYKNNSYAKSVIAILLFLIFIDILGIVFSIKDILYLKNIIAYNIVEESEHTFFSQKNLVEYWVSTIGHIIYGILFLTWFYRAYKNVYLRTSNDTPCRPGLVPFSFLIPIFNLYAPYQILTFIWRENNFLVGHEIKNKGYRLINIWWSLSLLTLIYSRFCSGKYKHAEYANEYLTATYLYLFYYLISILFSIVAIEIIKRINKLEKERIDL